MMRAYTVGLVALTVLSACAGTDDRTFWRPDSGSTADDMAVVDAGADPGADASVSDDASTGDGEGDGSFPPDLRGSGEDMAATEDMNSNLCRRNRDGVISRDELPLQAGLAATFAVASGVSFDTAGTDVDGKTVWDLTTEFDGERRELVELTDPAGTWWETTFPDADYYTPLSGQSDLLGVFQITDEALLLLGVVSPEDGLTKTELTYEPAVPVLRVPLQTGDEWEVDSTVSGFYNGVYSLYSERYVFRADETGEVRTPFANFDVVRVRSTLDREVGLLATTIRSFAFVTECFGTIATIASQENETEAEFQDVAELRRLAL